MSLSPFFPSFPPHPSLFSTSLFSFLLFFPSLFLTSSFFLCWYRFITWNSLYSLVILLALCPELWDYRNAPLCLTLDIWCQQNMVDFLTAVAHERITQNGRESVSGKALRSHCLGARRHGYKPALLLEKSWENLVLIIFHLRNENLCEMILKTSYIPVFLLGFPLLWRDPWQWQFW